MEAETLFTINGGRLVALTQGPTVPRGIGTAIASNLASFVDEPGLPIGSWDQTVHEDRPAVMSFTREGTIVSVLVSSMDSDGVSVRDRITAIHNWLSPMQLRDLSQLFKEPGAFYEGLWDMSPNATIALQQTRRYVVVTADPDTSDAEATIADVGDAVVDFVHLDVFTSEAGDDPIIRWHPTTPPGTADTPASTDPEKEAPATSTKRARKSRSTKKVDVSATADGETDVDVDAHPEVAADSPPPPTGSAAVVDLPEPEPIDLRDPEPDVTTPSGLLPGRTYPIETLPLIFDPSDEYLESISDEMFAVPGNLVLVDKLPERRRQPSPFENPGRYRWDADAEQQKVLEASLSIPDSTRVVHLFMESERQSGLATYVGLISSAEENSAGRYSSSMWFDIEPKVAAPLWQLFRKGRLPELGDTSISDLSIAAT
ncbi:MAG: hypothetical protein HKN94_13420 [Acidimicrobiales bacterium]|nr:hypothetical protein [Acidimicrobiales bacterium]RZV48108.1 MAG: hypothetical protein EX269_02975 [Acidimicrobiales bacterium]